MAYDDMKKLLGEGYGDANWKLERLAREVTDDMLRLLKREGFRSDAEFDAVAAYDWGTVMRDVVARAKKDAAKAAAFVKAGPAVPRTPADWQIYVGHEDAKEAAKALAAAAEKAAKELRDELKGVSDHKVAAKIIGQVFDKHLRPVMSKYSKTGATDTEPRNVGAQFLIDVAKHVMGIPRDEYTDLGDYI
jgi:hypothetical protein